MRHSLMVAQKYSAQSKPGVVVSCPTGRRYERPVTFQGVPILEKEVTLEFENAGIHWVNHETRKMVFRVSGHYDLIDPENAS